MRQPGSAVEIGDVDWARHRRKRRAIRDWATIAEANKLHELEALMHDL